MLRGTPTFTCTDADADVDADADAVRDNDRFFMVEWMGKRHYHPS